MCTAYTSNYQLGRLCEVPSTCKLLATRQQNTLIFTCTARARTWPVLEGSFVTRPGLLHADVLSELQEVNRQYCLRHGYRFVTEVSTSSPPSLYLSLSLPPPLPPPSLCLSRSFPSSLFLSHARGSRPAQAHRERWILKLARMVRCLQPKRCRPPSTLAPVSAGTCAGPCLPRARACVCVCVCVCVCLFARTR